MPKKSKGDKKPSKLHIIGFVNDHVNLTTRLDKKHYEWIVENTGGSKNSVLNFFVMQGIEKYKESLKKGSLYEEL